MSAPEAAGWARSSSHSVSVVPTSQWVPQGMMKSTLLGVRSTMPVSLSMRSWGTHEVDALGRGDPQPGGPGHVLDVVDPHAGGVDHLAGSALEAAVGLEVVELGADHDAVLDDQVGDLHRWWRWRRRGGPRCGPPRVCGERRRPGRRSTGSRRRGWTPRGPAPWPRPWCGSGGGGGAEGCVARVPGGRRATRPRRSRSGARSGGVRGSRNGTGSHEMRADQTREQASFLQRLVHEREVSLLEIPEPTVQELRGGGWRCPRRGLAVPPGPPGGHA